MLTPEDLGQRLRQAREQAGIKQEEAATALGLDATAITKIERGRRGLGALELVRLATLYKVPLNELIEDMGETEEIQLRIAMRAGTALDPKTSQMQRRLQQIIRDDRWLRRKLKPSISNNSTFPKLDTITDNLPNTNVAYEKGYQGATNFRQAYGLATSPIPNMEMLADEVGVLVCRLPLGDYQSPDGCSAIDPLDGIAYILINSDKPRVRRRFTIAHELGHLALGHLQQGEMVLDETTNSTQPEETEANAFAAELLMPAEGIRNFLDRFSRRLDDQGFSLHLAVRLAASFGVSEEAVYYRMLNLGLVGSSQYSNSEEFTDLRENPEKIKQVRTRLGLTPVKSDIERGITEVGPAMRARIAQALEKGLITIQRAAEMMHVSPQETYRWVVETGLNVRGIGFL